MNRLFTSTSRVLAALLFVALTTESAAQSFPLPYNPDENGDGLIGVVDLQGLLANYGSEFSGAVISEDGENAMTYMGDMAYPLCAQACRNLPGMWEMPEIEDLGLVWDEVHTTNTTVSTWLKRTAASPNQRPSRFHSEDNTNHNRHYSEEYQFLDFGARCYCTAKQLPRVEYTYCEGTDIQECANEKVEAGWYPLEGITKISYNGQNKIQAFWRWAE